MVILIAAMLGGFSIAAFLYVILTAFASRDNPDDKIRKRVSGLMRKDVSLLTNQAQFSQIFRLQAVMQRQPFLKQLYEMMVLSGWGMPVSVFLLIDCLIGFLAFMIANIFFENKTISIIAALGSAAIPYIFLVFNKQRYIDKFTINFPDALMMMKGSLQAGQGMQTAFRSVAEEGPAPISTEFNKVVQNIELGASVPEALNEMYQKIKTIDLRIFVLGVMIQQEVGGNLVELLERVENTIRERITLSREVKALSAQGKMSGGVLIMLPVGIGLVINLISPGYMKPLTDNEEGKNLLYIACGFQVIGSYIVHKITSFKMTS